MNNKRLMTIAQNFTNDHIIDVGSDHGYLPLYLLKNGKVQTTNIVEVNQGPLDNAKRNFKSSGLSEQATFTLSNGLTSYDNQILVNTGVTVAGMGGKLIVQIIDDSLAKFQQMTVYVQPNNNEYKLRKYLQDNNFAITEEYLVKDEGIIYEVFKAEYTSEAKEYSEEQLQFGVVLAQDELFKEKWEAELAYNEKLLVQIESAGHKNEKIEQLVQKIKRQLEQ